MGQKVNEWQQNLGNVLVAGKHTEQYQVSPAWCYAINNMEFIKESIDPVARSFGFDKIIEDLSETKSQTEAERCQNTLQLIIENAKDTMKNKIAQILEVAVKNMTPAVS